MLFRMCTIIYLLWWWPKAPSTEVANPLPAQDMPTR
jgi:hypothetical protein